MKDRLLKLAKPTGPVIGMAAAFVLILAFASTPVWATASLLAVGIATIAAGIVTLYGWRVRVHDAPEKAWYAALKAHPVAVPQYVPSPPVITQIQSPTAAIEGEILDPDVEERLWRHNTIETWTVRKQDDGRGYMVLPINKNGALMEDRAAARNIPDPSQAWAIANEGRRALGWIR